MSEADDVSAVAEPCTEEIQLVTGADRDAADRAAAKMKPTRVRWDNPDRTRVLVHYGTSVCAFKFQVVTRES
jgi:hypothetical protein